MQTSVDEKLMSDLSAFAPLRQNTCRNSLRKQRFVVMAPEAFSAHSRVCTAEFMVAFTMVGSYSGSPSLYKTRKCRVGPEPGVRLGL